MVRPGDYLPKPFPDPELYQAVLDAGFKTYPERAANYDSFKRATRGEDVDYLPIKIDVENVSRCNYHCTMCEVSDWPKYQRAGDMSLDDFMALIDSQYGLIEIKIQGLGEPLLGKCYADMISYARSRHIWVRSTSNAALMHLHDNYKRVVDADICELAVSIDGARAETYEKIRRGGIFSKVTKNCELLNSYAASAGRMRTRMATVVQRDNFDELEQLVSLASSLGFPRVTFALDLVDFGLPKWNQINNNVDMHGNFTIERGLALIEQGKQEGVDVSFWSMDEKYDVSSLEKLCPWPFERVYISSDMRIVSCCMIGNPDVFSLGDAHNLTAEWHGPNLKKFRRAHMQGTLPPICRNCYKRNDRRQNSSE